jgi:hypothetical protein
MKNIYRSAVPVLAVLFGLGVERSMAADPTDTTNNLGQVINSTYTFSAVGTSGVNFDLIGTTIPNLNNLPVTLHLVLTSITYVAPSVTGDGSTPTIMFNLGSVSLQNIVGGQLPSTEVTLTAPAPVTEGETETNVTFSLASSVVFTPVLEENPGNGSEDNGGLWGEDVSNLEPTPDSITLNGMPNTSVINNNLLFSGYVEVVYAVPEPSSWRLGLVALGFLGLTLHRRTRLKKGHCLLF